MSDKSIGIPPGDGINMNDLLKEYMSINNDLANLQRDLVQKNREIQFQEKRFRELVISNPDAQIVLSLSGEILFLNPAARTIVEECQQPIEEFIAHISNTESNEIRCGGDNHFVWVESRVKRIAWEGEPSDLLSIRDVSERKLAEEQRARANTLKGVLEMAGAAAHEFSQPLQSLRMDFEFIRDEISTTDQDVLEALQAITENMDRLADVVSKTQRITRYETVDYIDDIHIVDIDKATGDS